MKKDIDCQVFEEQLDALVRGTLSDNGISAFQSHAHSCPDCAMLLRVQEHLTLPSLRQLEAEVPEKLLESIWPGVEAETISGSPEIGSRPRAPLAKERAFQWMIPALAAASVVLLLTTGFLFSELRRTEAQGLRLAAQVEALERGLTDLDVRTDWVERTAELAGSRRSQAQALEYLLSGRDTLTVGALLELLNQLPGNRVLFDSSRLEEVTGALVRPPPGVREILPILANAMSSLENPREVRAGDLAEWLANSGLHPDLVIPTSPLLELLS